MLGGLVGVATSGAVCIGLGLMMEIEITFEGDVISAALPSGSIYVALIFGVVGLGQVADLAIDPSDFVIGVATGVGLMVPTAVVVATRGMPEGDLGNIGMFASVYFGVLTSVLTAGGTLATLIH